MFVDGQGGGTHPDDTLPRADGEGRGADNSRAAQLVGDSEELMPLDDPRTVDMTRL